MNKTGFYKFILKICHKNVSDNINLFALVSC